MAIGKCRGIKWNTIDRRIAILIVIFIISLLTAISGCTGTVSSRAGDNGTANVSTWSFTINSDPSKTVNSTLYARLANCSQEYNPATDIPPGGGILLEYFLYDLGVYPVTSVSYNGTTYNWTNVTYVSDKDNTPLVTPNGSLYYRGTWAHVDNVNVSVTESTNVSTLDVEPSILYALDAGVSKPGLLPNKTRRVVLIYIDAFGYQRYQNSVKLGLVDNISALGKPIKAHCEYPSFSQVNAKAMVTGVAPDLVKGDFSTDVPDNETMFDVLDRQGKTAVWVDGHTGPVKINNAIYNKDQNGDGSEEEEVAACAIQQYRDGASLVAVHFDSTDSAMHQYGPDSPQAEAEVKRTDGLVEKIVASLDKGTAVVVWADHGCHTTIDGGDHHTLLPDDMYIPIFVHYV